MGVKVRYIGGHDEVAVHDPETGEQVAVVKQNHQTEVPDHVAKSLSDDWERVKADKKGD